MTASASRALRRAPLAAIAVLAPLLLGSCRNACQSICVELADYAKRDCGLDFGQDQIDQCVSDYAVANLPDGEAKACRQEKGKVADQWSCSDLEFYFGETGDTGGDTAATASATASATTSTAASGAASTAASGAASTAASGPASTAAAEPTDTDLGTSSVGAP